MVLLADFAQSRRVKEDRVCGSRGSGTEVHVVWREKPGPAEIIARSERANWKCFMHASHFKRDITLQDYEKSVRRIAFSENPFISSVVNLHRQAPNHLELLDVETCKEGLSGYQVKKVVTARWGETCSKTARRSAADETVSVLSGGGNDVVGKTSEGIFFSY